ncbi:MAG: gamma-glutamyl-gamma-aminobutyrate hydrolase family protein, partial [Actinobacteria bacterium]|nr:gamma-glutamyl-gamma-aminobutyrate hydrolase family protein [Actinomycetota bacterium]
MRPIIGISCWPEDNSRWFFVPMEYVHAVKKAGGLPMILPFAQDENGAAEILERMDGLLLTGGVDPDPKYWGEEPHPKLGKIQPERDASDLAMAKVAMNRDMPLLGICRGHQVIAVAAGGSLYQDIPSQIPGCLKHSQDAPRWYPTHAVKTRPGSRVAALLPGSFRVNSFHHQSVKGVPEGFITTAEAEDGVVEAIESTRNALVMGVQWHPERMWNRPINYD